MFDKYLIVDNSLRNIGPAGAPTGFAFDVMLGYYRGIGLSMVEALDATVDGDAIDPRDMTFDDGNGAIAVPEMEHALDRRWPFAQPATIVVQRPGGLARGDHQVTLNQRLRVSYMPFPSVNTDAKTLSL